MLIYPDGSDSPLRGDEVLRVVLRSDLTPIPMTIEIDSRKTTDSIAALKPDGLVSIGSGRIGMRLIKVVEQQGTGQVQGDRELAVIRATGILDLCAPIAQRLQRAVVREGSSLGEIYRACGAQVRIEQDFTVPTFACYTGMTPSFEVAKVLQEEAGALLYRSGRVAFRRLRELSQEKAAESLEAGQVQMTKSSFLERHAVPFAYTTDAAGRFIVGRRSDARGVLYRPRADGRIVNNMGVSLVQTAKYRAPLMPNINAGARFDVGGIPMVVVTAAHVFELGMPGEGQEQYSQFWLGEVKS